MFGFTSKNTSEPQPSESTLIYFCEDFSDKDVSEALVGRKGKSLFSLRDMDVPVPDFFLLSPAVYKRFLVGAFDNKLQEIIEKSKSPDPAQLEKLIEKANFDQEFYDELLRSYTRLSGFSNTWVAVRSSVVYPQDPSVSFSGVFRTELNVRGISNIIDAIKQVYASVFQEQVLLYAANHGVNLLDLQMSVVVQRMVQPEVSGICYTLDPVTNDEKVMSVEAVFGLGDVISDGSITPDQYQLEKKKLDILEKHIAPQEWMKIRRPPSENSKQKGLEEFQKIQISSNWSHQQKLEDKNIKEVAKISLIVEESSNSPQIIEWIWEGGTVWILQSKPHTAPAAAPSVAKQEVTAPVSAFGLAVEMLKENKVEELTLTGSSMNLPENIAQLESTAEISNVTAPRKPKIDLKAVEKIGKLKNSVPNVKVVREKAKPEVETPLSPFDGPEMKPLVAEVGISAPDVAAATAELSALELLSKKIRELGARSIKKAEQKLEKVEVKESKKLDESVSESRLSMTEARMEFLLTGIGASQGSATGFVRVLRSLPTEETLFTKEHILLIKGFTSNLEKYLYQAGGVVMDEGGLTSDVAILCREIGIPAVVGTGLASALLSEGDVIKIDGNVGSVYRMVKEADSTDTQTPESKPNQLDVIIPSQKIEQPPPSSKAGRKAAKKPKNGVSVSGEKILTATKLFLAPEPGARAEKYSDALGLVDGVGMLDLDQLLICEGKHPLHVAEAGGYKEYSKEIEHMVDAYADAVLGNEVLLSVGSATIEMFKSLVGGDKNENEAVDPGMYGVQRYMSNKKFLEKVLNIVKRSRNVYKNRNISLALHSPINGDLMKEMKKELSASGLRRTGTFKLYAVIDKPSEIILIDEIVSSGLDGVVVNTPRLARQMQGLPLFGSNVKYDLSTSSVLKMVESAVNSLREKKLKIFVVVENDKDLIKRCIEYGVYGVIVSADEYAECKKVVSEMELKMVMRV